MGGTHDDKVSVVCAERRQCGGEGTRDERGQG